MKLRLTRPLFLCLLGGLSNLIPAYSLEVTIPDGSTTRQEYTEETTVKTTGDILSYTNWICSDPSTSTRKGAIFHSTANLTFSGGYGISITGSTMNSLGGLFYSGKNITFSQLGNITLTNNTSKSSTSGYINGGLIYANNTITFSDVNDIYIANNLSEELSGGYPSLIYSANGGVVFERTGNITFLKNISKKGTGNLYIIRADRAPTIFNDTGDILFDLNEGGVLSSNSGITFIQTKSITFSNNHGLQENGGGIYITSNTTNLNRLAIMQSGDVQFLNNSSGLRGGAIASRQYSTAHASDILLSADKGNILFRGNMHQTDVKFNYFNPVLNAIQFDTFGAVTDAATLTVRAQEGREVTFFDPVISTHTVKGQLMIVDFNAAVDPNDPLSASYGTTAPAFSGTIRFSGKHVQESIIKDQTTAETEAEYQARLKESKHSNIRANTTLHGGTLILEEGAVYGADIIKAILANSMTTFSLKEACLEIRTGGTLNAVTFTTTGTGSLLRAGNDAHLFANHVDLSAGFSFDFTPFLDQNDQAGLFLHGGKLTLGGNLGVYDNTTLDYYSNNRWANAHSFVVLDATNLTSGTTGSLVGIVSQATGSNVIDSPYGYQGTWSYEWKDDQLLAQWTPSVVEPPVDPEPPVEPGEPGEPEPPVNPGIQDIHPELAGNLTLNSLWSSVSNINSLGAAALGQLGLQRFQLQKNTNYWASGLGDFSYHNTVGRVDGYEYAGGGGAVGTDNRLTENVVVGIAFGTIFGTNKSDLYSAEIEQESYMGMIYGAGYKKLDEKNILSLQGSAAYGLTDNSLKTTYSDGQHSSGGWDNNTFQFTLKGSWDHVLENNWMITTFIGLEYADAQQKAFTESGDRVRSIGTGSLRNLSMPVGVAFSHLSSFGNGMKWFNSLSVSYVPDVYRKNPETEAMRLSNGFTWTAEGSKPARNAARIDLNTRLMMNETWSTFAGYSVEGREKSLYQTVNLGVSATF